MCNSPGCPGAHSVEEAGLEFTDPPASQVLGLKRHSVVVSKKIYSEAQVGVSCVPGLYAGPAGRPQGDLGVSRFPISVVLV